MEDFKNCWLEILKQQQKKKQRREDLKQQEKLRQFQINWKNN